MGDLEEPASEIPMSPEEREMYEAAIEKAKAIFSDHSGKSEYEREEDSGGGGDRSDNGSDPEAGSGMA